MNELASKLFSMLPDKNKEDTLLPYITQVNNDLTDYMRYQKNFDPEKELSPTFEQIGFEDIHELLLQDVGVLKVLESIFNELASALIAQQASMLKIKSLFESLDNLTLDPSASLNSFGLPSNFLSSLSTNSTYDPSASNNSSNSSSSTSSTSNSSSSSTTTTPSLASWGFSLKQALDSFRVLSEQEITRSLQAEKYLETARALRQERHQLIISTGDYFKQLFYIEKEVLTAEKKLLKAKETLELKYKNENEKILKKYSNEEFLPDTFYTSYAIVSVPSNSTTSISSTSISTSTSNSHRSNSSTIKSFHFNSSTTSPPNLSSSASTPHFSIIPHPSLHQDIRSLSHALNHRDLFHAALRLALNDLHEKMYQKIETTLKNFFTGLESTNSSLQIIMNLIQETSQSVSFKKDINTWIKKKTNSSSSLSSSSSSTSTSNHLILYSQPISFINNLSITSHENYFKNILETKKRFYYHFYDYDLTKAKSAHLSDGNFSENRMNRFKNFLSNHLFPSTHLTNSYHSRPAIKSAISAGPTFNSFSDTSTSTINSVSSLPEIDKLIDHFLKLIFSSTSSTSSSPTLSASSSNSSFSPQPTSSPTSSNSPPRLSSTFFNFFQIEEINLINDHSIVEIITKNKIYHIVLPPTLSIIEKYILIQSYPLISSILFFHFYIFSSTSLREKFVNQLNRYRSSKICLKTRNFLSLVVLLWLFLGWCNGLGTKIIKNKEDLIEKTDNNGETSVISDEELKKNVRKARNMMNSERINLRRSIEKDILEQYSFLFNNVIVEEDDNEDFKDVDVRSARVVLMLSETFYRIRSPTQSLFKEIEQKVSLSSSSTPNSTSSSLPSRLERKISEVDPSVLLSLRKPYCFLCCDSIRLKDNKDEKEEKEEEVEEDDEEEDEDEDDMENPLRGVRYRQYIQEKLIGHPLWNDSHFWQRTLWDSTRDSLLTSLPPFLYCSTNSSSIQPSSSFSASVPSVSSPIPNNTNKLIRPWFDLTPSQRMEAVKSVHTVLTNHALALSHALLILTNNNNISKENSLHNISHTLNYILSSSNNSIENSFPNCCQDCYSLITQNTSFSSLILTSSSPSPSTTSNIDVDSLEYASDTSPPSTTSSPSTNVENFNSFSPTIRAREFIFRASALHGLPQSLRLFLLNHIEEQEKLSQTSSESSSSNNLSKKNSNSNRNRLNYSPQKGNWI